MRKALLLLLAIVCLAGCTDRHVREQLDKAERIVSDRPDSALAILAALPDKDRLSTEARARRDLLMAEARYMADSTDTAPARLLETAAYFELNKDPRNAARAYYYAGMQYRNKESYGEAIVNYLKAGKRTDSHLFLGQIYRATGDAYGKLMDWASSNRCHLKAYDEFKADLSNKYFPFSQLDVAQTYFNICEYDSAAFYANETLRSAKSINNRELETYALRILAKVNSETNKVQRTIAIYKNILTNYSGYAISEDYRELGLAYLSIEDFNSAKEILTQRHDILPDDHLLEINIAERTGNYEDAFKLLKNTLCYQNDVVERMCIRDHANIIDQFYQTEEAISNSKIKESKQETKYTIWIAVLLFLLIVSVSLYIILRLDKRKDQLIKKVLIIGDELSKKEDEIKALENKQAESRTKSSALEKSLAEQQVKEIQSKIQIKELFKSPAFLIERLRESLEETSSKKTAEHLTYSRVQKIVTDLTDAKTLKGMEDIADRYLDNIMKDFKADFPKPGKHEQEIFLYRISGFSYKTIAYLLGIDAEGVYRKKYKLRHRILESDSARKEDYIGYLS